ncbi:hypothetical protein GOV06_03880 [Candidatus Woesearchaeota archaeon]|nr:hypothetical protein [Candidatus Woesearchaeota archaeon]
MFNTNIHVYKWDYDYPSFAGEWLLHRERKSEIDVSRDAQNLYLRTDISVGKVTFIRELTSRNKYGLTIILEQDRLAQEEPSGTSLENKMSKKDWDFFMIWWLRMSKDDKSRFIRETIRVAGLGKYAQC